MTPLVIKYPLDPSGTSPDNLIRGERHTMIRRNVRAIATTYGGYYADSLVVTDVATGQPLTADQFYAAEMYEQPTLEYGKMICSIVIIVDPGVSDNVDLSYQVLGGPYQNQQTALVQMLETLLTDDRPVSWGNIIDRPDRFPPAAHLHDAGDIYGFEYVVFELQRIREAILIGDEASHDELRRYMDTIEQNLLALINQGNAALQAHIDDKENPHETDAHMVGTYFSAEIDALLNALRTELTSAFTTQTMDSPAGVTLVRATHNKKWVFVNTTGLVNVNPNSFQKDDFVIFTNDSASTVRIVPATGMTITAPYGQNLTMMGAGASCALQFKSPTRAVLIGATQYT